MNIDLDTITRELFSRDAISVLDDDSTDELYEKLKETAAAAIEKYGWDAVFESWQKYMHEHCHTAQEALSFATWFEAYGGHEHKISDPYGFLAYLYDIFDLNPVKYDAQIMDDISYGLLESTGIKKNLWSDDSYTTETDPELIRAVEKIRQKRQQNNPMGYKLGSMLL